MKERRLRTILTTNFDDLIHDALFRYADDKPAVCSFDSQITALHPNTARPVIVKLHGDFMYNNMRNVGPEVQRLSQNMRDKLFQTCKSNGLIVVGYGGGDDSIMMPLASMLHDGNYLEDGLHWCLYAEKGAKTVWVPGEVSRLAESHPNKVRLYYSEGFDDAMEKLYVACKCKPLEDLIRPQDHSLYRRLHKGLENANQRFKVSKRFNELLKEFLEANGRDRSRYEKALDQAEYHFASMRRSCELGSFEDLDQPTLFTPSEDRSASRPVFS